MTPHQLYIDALLDAISNEPFPSDDQRETLLTLKKHLASVSDLGEELRRLYTVDHFADFALSLMWVQKQVDLDPGRSESDPEDQYLVSMKFRQAVAGKTPESEPEHDARGEDSPRQESAPEEAPPEPEALAEDRPPMSYAPDAPEDTFPLLLDKFVIAMQSGVDDRTRLFDRVMNAASEIGQPDSDYSSDLQEFCSKLVTFLSYVKRNEYLEDVRTMNILSTISDAMSAWSSASIETRMGLLSEGIKVLAEAQSHFE